MWNLSQIGVKNKKTKNVGVYRILLSCFLVLTFFVATAGTPPTIKTVVIDAGHGGKDPGAIGPGKTQEKDIALIVALKLGDYITKNYPDVKVVYTRKTDQFIELHERAEIANRNKADLFIAVHCNSSTNPEAYGTSTYVLGLHRTEANLEVAKRENGVISLEDNKDKNYEFDPNSPEGHIIMSMKQNIYLDQSINFASHIENQFETYSRRKSLGVKQAGFYVLYKTAMPSLLCEIGFLSNPEEEKYLNSVKGQDNLASALFNAFKEYKGEMEGKAATAGSNDNKPTETAENKPTEKQPAAETKTTTTTTVQPSTNKPTTTTTEAIKDTAATAKSNVKPPTETGIEAGGVSKNPEKKESVPVYIETSNIDPSLFEDPSKKTVKPETKTTETKPAETKPTAEVKPVETKTTTTVKPAENKTTTTTAVKTPEKTTTTTTVKPAENKVTTTVKTETKPTADNAAVLFKVQLFALTQPLKDQNKIEAQFGVLQLETTGNGFTRYLLGNYPSYELAEKIVTKAKAAGYKEAFVVGYKNGQRLTPSQTAELKK